MGWVDIYKEKYSISIVGELSEPWAYVTPYYGFLPEEHKCIPKPLPRGAAVTISGTRAVVQNPRHYGSETFYEYPLKIVKPTDEQGIY